MEWNSCSLNTHGIALFLKLELNNTFHFGGVGEGGVGGRVAFVLFLKFHTNLKPMLNAILANFHW